MALYLNVVRIFNDLFYYCYRDLHNIRNLGESEFYNCLSQIENGVEFLKVCGDTVPMTQKV